MIPVYSEGHLQNLSCIVPQTSVVKTTVKVANCPPQPSPLGQLRWSPQLTDWWRMRILHLLHHYLVCGIWHAAIGTKSLASPEVYLHRYSSSVQFHNHAELELKRWQSICSNYAKKVLALLLTLTLEISAGSISFSSLFFSVWFSSPLLEIAEGLSSACGFLAKCVVSMRTMGTSDDDCKDPSCKPLLSETLMSSSTRAVN